MIIQIPNDVKVGVHQAKKKVKSISDLFFQGK